MKKDYRATIRLTAIEQLKTFIRVTSDCLFDVDLERGRYNVDAKSILGVMSLDLSKPVTLVAHAQTEEQFAEYVSLLGSAGVEVSP